MRAEDRAPYRLPYLTLRRGIFYEEDWLRWLDEARIELEQMAAESAALNEN